MAEFRYAFTVPAPLAAVRDFHHDTRVLKRLSPPPIFVQLHRFEPLAENAEASFTMWFGPIPVRWRAVHTNVGAEGFTDTQLSGPLRRWEHTHRFTAVDEAHTRVDERIKYEHKAGLKGLLTRLFFNRPALSLLFTYRQLVTRWRLRDERLQGRVAKSSVLLAIAGALLALVVYQRRSRC